MDASPHLLILFQRLKNTPLDNLLEFFAVQNYCVFAASDGLPTRSMDAIRRAHDLFACRNERLDLANGRASAAQTGR